MDLWIRSQDKGLYKIVGFKPPFCCNENETQSKYAIIGICYEYRTLELGVYKSKERAIEVLDEIQKRILNGDAFRTLLNIQNENAFHAIADKFKKISTACIYEMPKE